MPNMVWIIRPGGRIAYKANWTSAINIESFLERYDSARSSRRAGNALSPYQTEQVEYRENDLNTFFHRLERNGDHSVADFRKAMEIW